MSTGFTHTLLPVAECRWQWDESAMGPKSNDGYASDLAASRDRIKTLQIAVFWNDDLMFERMMN